MFKVAISLGMRGNRFDTHFATGAQYAQSDFATVGDQEFFDHQLTL